MIKVDRFFGLIGSEVRDEYDRTVGTLVSFSSGVDGEIKSVEIKIVDRGLERIPGERVKLVDGRIVVSPEWKFEALRVIEALERAYKRRKAVENIAKQSNIPAEIVENMRRQLSEEIKRLRIRAEEVKTKIKSRISEIDDEMLHVASATANLQMLYFSGEISDKSYTSGMNHLRKLNETLEKEKQDAKHVLDKLEKTHEAATGVLESPTAKVGKADSGEAKHGSIGPATATKAPSSQESEILVKIEEG
ncbi:MAG: CdvA-like protein [Aeropyrum sp.]|nr:CdvA-like protein [Aeropyrum sp.]MCE4615975.1 CdvA-like protein [Aeropyrum sp.]